MPAQKLYGKFRISSEVKKAIKEHGAKQNPLAHLIPAASDAILSKLGLGEQELLRARKLQAQAHTLFEAAKNVHEKKPVTAKTAKKIYESALADLQSCLKARHINIEGYEPIARAIKEKIHQISALPETAEARMREDWIQIFLDLNSTATLAELGEKRFQLYSRAMKRVFAVMIKARKNEEK